MISSPSSSIHFRIINYWFGFILFLIAVSNIPHQSMPVMSWLNCSLFFVVCLQCFFIARHEISNRAIFINLGIYSLLWSLSFVNPFIGTGYLMGDDFMGFYVFQYRKILMSFLLGLAVTYILMRYVFPTLSTLATYLVSLAVLLPVLLISFWPYLADRDYLVNLPNNSAFYKANMFFTSFCFLIVWLYGVFLYRNERSLGHHVNALVVCYFFLTLMDIIDGFGDIYGIKLFSLSQVLLLIIHALFITTLFRRLNFVYSEFGRFYEAIAVQGNAMGVPIKRKKSHYAIGFVNILRAYFHHQRNLIWALSLAFVFGINYFDFSLFFKINLAALWFGVIILFAYVSALLKKRSRAGDFLALRRARNQVAR